MSPRTSPHGLVAMMTALACSGDLSTHGQESEQRCFQSRGHGGKTREPGVSRDLGSSPGSWLLTLGSEPGHHVGRGKDTAGKGGQT